MADDAARLIVSVEAKIDRLEKQLNKATGVADKKTRQIENRFKKANSAIGKSADAAGGKMNRFLRGATTSATLLQGPLSGVGSRISAISGSLSRGNIAMAGFALTIGGVVYEAKQALDAFEKFEVSQRTIEAALKATGGASGKTAGQIEELAQSIALNTLASTEGVRNAAAKLLTFRSISGDAFDETLRLAQDLAATGFGTLETNIVQLGKALEDPITGLTALKRSGVSFSESQKQIITNLVDTGRAAEAQRVILETLAKQVGGIGAAQAGGTVAGAYDTLSQSTENLLVNWGKQIAKAIDLEARISAVARAVQTLDAATGGGTTKDQLAAVNEQIAALENLSDEAKLARRAVAAVGGAIGRAVGSAFGGPIGSVFGGILGDSATSVEEKLVQLERLRTVLRRRAFAERLKELNAAEAGIEAQNKIVDDERAGKITAVTAELDKQLKLAGKLGVEREKALARAKAQVTAESAAGQQIAGKIDELARVEFVAKQLADLRAQIDDAQLGRDTLGLSEFDAARRIEYEKRLNDAKQQGIVLTDADRVALLARADELVRAKTELQKLREAQEAFADTSKEALSGFITDLKDGTSAAESLANVLDNIANKLINLGASKLVDALLAPSGSIGGTGGLLGGAIIPGILHDGGVAGRDGYGHGRSVSPSTFARAPRYHKGGVAGLQPGEVPAILKQGEVVLPSMPKVASPGAASAQAPVNVVTNVSIDASNATPEAVSKLNSETIPQIRKIVQSEVVQLFERKQRFSRSGI